VIGIVLSAGSHFEDAQCVGGSFATVDWMQVAAVMCLYLGTRAYRRTVALARGHVLRQPPANAGAVGDRYVV
jgi:hypothetical protein